MKQNVHFKPSPALILVVELLLAAKTVEQSTKKIVTDYQNKIIEKNRAKWVIDDKDAPPDTVLAPENIYWLSEAHIAEYSDACDVAALAAGFNEKPGYCPLLVAEKNIIQLETILIKEIAKLPQFEGITKNKLLCQGMPALTKFIELSTTLVTPFIKREPDKILTEFETLNFDVNQAELESQIEALVNKQGNTRTRKTVAIEAMPEPALK